MSLIDLMIDTLRDRVNSTPIHPKRNKGLQALKLHGDIDNRAEEYVLYSLDIVVEQWKRSLHHESYGVTASFTNVIRTIGTEVGRILECDPLPHRQATALGVALVNIFFHYDFLRVVKDGDTSKPIDAPKERFTQDRRPNVIIPGDNCDIDIRGMLKRYTTTTKPLDITGPTQIVDNGDVIGVVKRTTTRQQDLEGEWAEGFNKMQQQGWLLNKRTFRAMLKNRDKVISCDPYSEPRDELQRRSKLIERKLFIKAALAFRHHVYYSYCDLDYRSRVYYKQPFFNFQGSDIQRGMFLFSEGKKLGKTGVFWLKVHTACCYNQSYKITDIPHWVQGDYKSLLEEQNLNSISVDKMTLEDRARWTENNMDLVLKFAKEDRINIEDNLEKPYSFLSCCYEWKDAGDCPEEHVSFLPVPVDGANNGWQHLAAISKDIQKGELVGLVPVEIQNDFYVQTAKRVIAMAKEDLLVLLKSMEMKDIRKGVSKRGSMTRAYSSGRDKIAENMWNDCLKEKFNVKYGLTEEHCKQLSSLLIKAIDEVCPGPLKTMKYLQRLAAYQLGSYIPIDADGNQVEANIYNEYKDIRKELKNKKNRTDEEDLELSKAVSELESYEYVKCKGLGKDVITWKTPSGFRVVYEKWQMSELKDEVVLRGFKRYNNRGNVKIVMQVPTDKPDHRGFMCGISPNFIHSQDASHLAIVAARWHGSFGAVHDSFSTHACDVPDLIKLTKDVFVEMYNYENYFDTIQSLFSDGNDGLDQPELGTLDIGDIYGSSYFFA